MNELYGPLVMLRGAARTFRAVMPPKQQDGRSWPKQEDGRSWAVVDHIEEAWSGEHDDWRDAIEEILKINEKIEELLTTKAGLYETWPPLPSFQAYISNSMALRLSWVRKENQPPNSRLTAPRDFDDQIEQEFGAVRKRLDAIGRGASK